MNTTETDLLERMGEVEPLPGHVSTQAMTTLRTAMAAEAQAIVIDRARTRRRAWPLVASAASVAAVTGLAMGAFGFSAGGAGHAPTRPTATAPSGLSQSPVAGHIHLASYTFALPAGYVKQSRSCPGLAAESVSASSTTGGCVDVGLTSDDPPAGATSVSVGPYTGALSTRGEDVDLSVAIPTAGGHRYLAFAARGLSAAQVVAMARSGLPTSIGPVTSCTANCG